MIKRQQVFRLVTRAVQWNIAKPLRDRLQVRRTQPRSHQHRAQRVDIAPRWNTTQQGRLDRRRAAAHERIVDTLAGPGEALDEKAR